MSLISVIKDLIKEELCDACKRRLTKKVYIYKTDEGKEGKLCSPCGEIAKKPREEIRKMISEANEEIRDSYKLH